MSATIPSTTNPCPAWCEEPAGHGYYCETMDGKPCRSHSMEVGYLISAHEFRKHACDVTVAINSMEVAESDDDPNPLVDFPLIRLTADMVDISADEARTIAAHLLKAADKLDEITGSEHANVDR